MFKPLSPVEALARQLEQSQTQALARLTDVDPLRVIYAESGWRVQDIIAHLTAWEEEVIRSLQAHQYNSSYRISEFELEAFNQAQYQQRRFLPYRQVVADWLAARSKLRWQVKHLKPEKFERQMIYPSGRSGECLALIHEVMSHQNEHMQDILNVLAGKQNGELD